MIPRFLIWPTFWRSQGSKISKWHQYGHVSLLFDLEHSISNLVWTCIYRHFLQFCWISAWSNFKYGRQAAILLVAILENQQSAITPELMAGSSPNLYHRYIVHLIRIHDMIPGFLIWPTFWRSQRSKFKTAPILAHYYLTWNILTLCEHV
jgi:hypothetical protein